MQIIETERLILRLFEESDAICFFELNADAEVMQFTGDDPFETIDAVRNFIQNYDAYENTGVGRWTVVLKSTNKAIGWCGLKVNPGQYVDLGYRLLKNHWGNGYATEAAKATLKFGFESCGFTKIVGRTAQKNSASIRVLEKLGMEFWKRDTCKGIEDSIYYRIEREKFKPI